MSEEEGWAWEGRKPVRFLDSITEMVSVFSGILNEKLLVIATKKMTVNSVGIK